MSTTIKRPRGRIPKRTKAWLELNPEYWELAVCKCGRWYRYMDKLAPYHVEMNWCDRCGSEFERKEGP